MTSERPGRIPDWLYAAPVLAVMHVVLLAVIHARPGRIGAVLWQIGPLVLTAGAIAALAAGFVQALRKRLTWTPLRAAAYLLLVVMGYMPLAYRTYPSSRDAYPSTVRFELPLAGPVTVAWGGATRDVNYHVRGAADRWAYDLLVTERGLSYRTSGLTVDDYLAYGMPVLAPAGGVVRSVVDGEPDSRLGARTLLGGCGNRVVIEVAAGEFLFVCHLQAGSIRVETGSRVEAGHVLGRVGNSGNSTEPHVHVHVQTTPDYFGEGIPMYFHDYREEGRLVPRGMPTGGNRPSRIERSRPREIEGGDQAGASNRRTWGDVGRESKGNW